MKLISWNVNGLRALAAKDGFGWLDEVKPDFLGLQEIKVKESDVPKEIYNLASHSRQAGSILFLPYQY